VGDLQGYSFLKRAVSNNNLAVSTVASYTTGILCQGGFLSQIAFYLPSFWILGAIGLYYRHPLANILSRFVFFGMFLSEPTHLLVFSNLKGGATTIYGVGGFSCPWLARGYFEREKHKIISMASCTTNALAAVVKVVLEN
jgi:hypothetical protein